MIDEQDLDQPWVAPSAPKFKIGDRVKIRLSPECPDKAHVSAEDGVSGTIEGIWPNLPAGCGFLPGHPCLVQFDFGVLPGRSIFHPYPRIADRFAFSEIELLP